MSTPKQPGGVPATGSSFSLAALFVFMFAVAWLAMIAREGFLKLVWHNDQWRFGPAVAAALSGGVLGTISGWRWSRSFKGTCAGLPPGVLLGVVIAAQIVSPPPAAVSAVGALLLVTLAWLVSPRELESSTERGPGDKHA